MKTLPDPPGRWFDTKKVNSSDTAYGYAGPDSPVTIVAHGVNMMLATMGGPDRPERLPLIPLAATAAAAAQAAVAGRYLFWQMPKVERAYCPYCVVDALAIFATLALTLARVGAGGQAAVPPLSLSNSRCSPTRRRLLG